MYRVVVDCGYWCARECDVVLCSLLTLLLVCVVVREPPGCLVSPGCTVDDRTGYRRVLVVLPVVGTAACCLRCVVVRRLCVLLLLLVLMWLVLLLLLLLRLMVSN